jgi:hypothetical protein
MLIRPLVVAVLAILAVLSGGTVACDSSAREEHIATPVQIEKPPEPELPKKPEGPPVDAALLDRMLVAEPTYLWSAAEQRFACAGSTRKREDTTYAVSFYDAHGKRIEEPVQLVTGAREFANKRKPIDAALAKGFTPLTRTAWPKHDDALVIADRGIELQWDGSGEVRVVEGKKPVSATKLERKDFVPIAAHLGATDAVLVEVTFDPKDKTAMDVQYTDCVVVPLAAAK